MKIVPHVDVIGDDRIQEILDDSANYVLDAFDAEVIEGWEPNIGQKAFPFRLGNGLFRSPSLANSGIPVSLRHRFWAPEEAERVIGKKYIGLLIYDSEEDDYVFSLKAGSEEIGRVKPTRHDNRRHLIVAKVKAQILSGGIPFEVKAEGKGPCYLESIVYMPQLPQPSSFVPQIKRPFTRIIGKDEHGVSIEVNFISTESVTAIVKAVPNEEVGKKNVITARSEVFYPLHRIRLDGLREDCDYTITIIVTEKEGERSEKGITFSPADEVVPLFSAKVVPVEVNNLSEAKASSLPLTFGVPLAKGSMSDPKSARILCGDEESYAQTRVHSRWPDGSPRWVLIDADFPFQLNPNEREDAKISLEDSDSAPTSGLHCDVNADSITVTGKQLRVTVSAKDAFIPARIEVGVDGGWKTVLGEGAGGINAVLGNGLVLKGGALENLLLEEAGPNRAVIGYDVPIVDQKGIAHFKSTFRIHIFDRHPFVKVVHRLNVISPVPGAGFWGNLDHITSEYEHAVGAIVGEKDEAVTLLDLKSFELQLPWRNMSEVGFENSLYSTAADNDFSLIQEHDLSYRIKNGGQITTVDGRAEARFNGRLDGGCFGFALRDFWKTYPKGIRIGPSSLSLEIFPKLSGEPQPDYEEGWHLLYFWYDKEKRTYKIKPGMAFTSEMLFVFPEKDEEIDRYFSWFDQPAVVRPDIDYLNDTRALETMAAKAKSPHPQYEAMVDSAINEWLDHREQMREYGFINFGDTFKGDAKRGGFWENNEYDSPFCHYSEFLRGGDPRWYPLASETSRHLIDIDTCNYSRDPSQIGAQYTHMAGHTGGYHPPYFRNKMRGSTSIPSHMWVEGPILHYLLTGDEGARETIDKTARWMVFTNLNNYEMANARECGWQLIHLCGLTRLDDNPQYLNAATIIVEKVLEKQSPGGGWERPLTESHCHCKPTRCRGEAGFMTGILLSGLRRYHDITADPRVADAIVGGAKWLIEKTYVPQAGHFRYTSCENRGEGPHPQYSLQVLEGLADAYRISRDPLIGDIIKRNLADLGLPGEELSGRPRFGKQLCLEARYIPALLSMVESMGLNLK